MREIRFRVPMEMDEATDRVGQLQVSPWEVLGVSPEASRDEILDAYDRLCDEADALQRSADPVDQVNGEERVRDYTAIVLVLSAD